MPKDDSGTFVPVGDRMESAVVRQADELLAVLEQVDRKSVV